MLKDFLARSPFVFLAVLGLITIPSTFMTLDENLATAVSAWKDVTRPIWEYLFGWTGWELPWYFKDYLTTSTAVAGMFLRSSGAVSGGRGARFPSPLYLVSIIVVVLSSILFWPFMVWDQIRPLPKVEEDNSISKAVNRVHVEERLVFWETGVFLVIFVSLNYFLIGVLDRPSVPPEIGIWV